MSQNCKHFQIWHLISRENLLRQGIFALLKVMRVKKER